MRIHVVEHDDSIAISIAELKKAIRYFSKLLSIPKNVVIFVDFSSDNFYGAAKRHIAACGTDEDPTADKPPTKFFIELNRRRLKTPTGFVKAIAHEMVHVKQMSCGDLAFHYKYAVWQNQEYQYSSLHYFEYPWEIDAYGREYGLVYRYTDHCRGKLRVRNSRNEATPEGSPGDGGLAAIPGV